MDFIGEFALRREIARNDLEVGSVLPQFLADHIVWIEHKCLFPGDVTDEAEWGGKIGIAADENECVCRVTIDVGHHFGRKVDV